MTSNPPDEGQNGSMSITQALGPAQASPIDEASATPTITMQDVTVEFSDHDGKRVRALDNVSLACKPGEFLGLVGKSGCGKTTILNVLAGLQEPTRGAASVLGVRPSEARRRVGYMFARDALLPWRTALGNACVGSEIQKIRRDERRKRAADMLTGLGLGNALSRYPWQLSHGMRQRVALARTWVTDPAVLLMDEPFAALDVQTRSAARAQFLEIWERQRKSVVFVTHDLSEALLTADRVLLIADGRIQREVRVPFERPRKEQELRRSKKFFDLENELSEYIK